MTQAVSTSAAPATPARTGRESIIAVSHGGNGRPGAWAVKRDVRQAKKTTAKVSVSTHAPPTIAQV